MKAVVAAFNQEKALVGAFSVITNLRMDLFEALLASGWALQWRMLSMLAPPQLLVIYCCKNRRWSNTKFPLRTAVHCPSPSDNHQNGPSPTSNEKLSSCVLELLDILLPIYWSLLPFIILKCNFEFQNLCAVYLLESKTAKILKRPIKKIYFSLMEVAQCRNPWHFLSTALATDLCASLIFWMDMGWVRCRNCRYVNREPTATQNQSLA